MKSNKLQETVLNMKVNKEETTGFRIEKLRKQKGLTQTELSEKLGIQRNKLSYYETNERTPTVSDLIVLAKELNTTTDYLLCCSDINSSEIKSQAVFDYLGLNNEAIANLKSEREIESILEKWGLNIRLNEEEEKILDNINSNYCTDYYENQKSFVIEFLNYLLNNSNFDKFKKIAISLYRYRDYAFEAMAKCKLYICELEDDYQFEDKEYLEKYCKICDYQAEFEKSINISKVYFYEVIEDIKNLLIDYIEKKSIDEKIEELTKEFSTISKDFLGGFSNGDD